MHKLLLHLHERDLASLPLALAFRCS